MSAARPERVLVTGASRGIGRAIARALAAEGRHVVAAARSLDALTALAEEGRELSGSIAPLALDVDDDASLAGAIAGAEALVGRLDGLVPCAAIAEHRPLARIDAAQIDAHFRVNVRAPLLLCRDFAARAERGAAIVMVASTLAERPAPHTTVYAATKGALLSATRALALELAPRGIRVSAVSPGLVETDMIRALRLAEGEAPPADATEHAARVEAQLEGLRALVPGGRLGAPEEIAPAVSFLLDHPLAVGTVLVLDGGLTL